jgi:hypothetical protein
VSQYNQLTPDVQATKHQIAAVLYADDERATIGAVAAYLGVSCRGLLSAKRDPRNAENSHFVSASTLLPPGYTPAELVSFKFNSQSRVWRPGPEFHRHMDARLQQMFPPAPSVSAPSVLQSGLPLVGRTSSVVSAAPPTADTDAPANPDLTALLQHVVYLYRGSNYPMPGVLSLVAAGPLYRSGAIILDLYNHVYNHPGDGPKLIQWTRDHIPPADQPEFVACWKLATQQAKAAQAGWEAAGHRDELPPVPEVGVGRKKQRDERETTDPGIVAIGVALDRAAELRVRAVGARAAAVQNSELKSEFAAALLGFNIALVELSVAWEAKWRAGK